MYEYAAPEKTINIQVMVSRGQRKAIYILYVTYVRRVLSQLSLSSACRINTSWFTKHRGLKCQNLNVTES